MMDYRIIDGAENMRMEDIQRLLKMACIENLVLS